MNNKKSETSELGTESSESSNRPQIADDNRIPWPENPNGKFVSKRRVSFKAFIPVAECQPEMDNANKAMEGSVEPICYCF